MAAAISAINAKIRSQPVLNYVCSTRKLIGLVALTESSALTSTDFWGPMSNFGIPVAAIMDAQKDPEM
jgi:hypothetical protein